MLGKIVERLMPENEIKFVVRDYAELEALLTPFGWEDIEQGYLNPNNRIRRITYENGTQLFFFTYKQRLPNGHNLEIEARITASEFTEAWDYTLERVIKRRIVIEHGNVKWDIDFYRWSRPYFVLAEVEMPPDMQRPEAILSYLVKHLAYEVPRDDGRFAARRLSNENHVRAVARELGVWGDADENLFDVQSGH
jgi:CYTH domain-containing protein